MTQLAMRIHMDQDCSSCSQILYKVATVFPTPAVVQTGPAATSYTFAAGTYEYPFQFKVCLHQSKDLRLYAYSNPVPFQQCVQYP